MNIPPNHRIQILDMIEQSKQLREHARDMRLNGPRLMRWVWAWQWWRVNRHIGRMYGWLENE